MATNRFNINTEEYWDHRFGTKDWEYKKGYSQTRDFAEAQIEYLDVSADFNGTICDFGCGGGDAFPVYKKNYPNAKLVGIDFSKEAIKLCLARYGHIADFFCGTAVDVPEAEILICSNVLEHIDNDEEIVKKLRHRCERLYVVVPYDERPLSSEHVRTYDNNSFNVLNPLRKVTYLSKGWSKYGLDLWWGVYLKNVARAILGRPLVTQRRQIMFVFDGTLYKGAHIKANIKCASR